MALSKSNFELSQVKGNGEEEVEVEQETLVNKDNRDELDLIRLGKRPVLKVIGAYHQSKVEIAGAYLGLSGTLGSCQFSDTVAPSSLRGREFSCEDFLGKVYRDGGR